MENYYQRNKERLKNKELQKYYENKNKALEAYETKETANMLLTLVYFDDEKTYKNAIMTAITNYDVDTITEVNKKLDEIIKILKQLIDEKI